jgi:hypothetical protein
VALLGACNRTARHRDAGPGSVVVVSSEQGSVAAPSCAPAASATPVPLEGSANAVLLVSIDGLAARHVETGLEKKTLPTFARLLSEGAGTLNARCESRISVTIPNHTSMISGRPAVEVPGYPKETSHLVLYNYDPGGTATVHDENPALGYVTSVFDEVHDRGGRTLLYSSKDKFELYHRSYSAPYARKDPYPPDDGDDKIDDFRVIADSVDLFPKFIDHFRTAIDAHPAGPNFALLHFRETDSAGHSFGWDSDEYTDALLLGDELLGVLLDTLSTDATFEHTLLILTTDHGGTGMGHSNYKDSLVYRIPFIVWGPGVPGAVDLYDAALGSRSDPGTKRPLDEDELQPIRNGDAGNLALWLLGVPAIEGALHSGMVLAPAGCGG